MPSLPKLTPRAPPASLVVASPAVRGFLPAGACANKGASLTILGNDFGGASGKGAALGGQGIHVDLPVASWSNVSIAVTIPGDPRIQDGKGYYIGIERSDHSQWLSNIDKTITMCDARSMTLAPPGGSPAPERGGLASGGTTRSRAASTPETGAQPGAAGSGGAGSAALPPGGGSLPGGPLPASPRDAPALPQREDPRIEPGELVVVSSNMAEARQLAEQARGLGLAIRRRTILGALGFVVSVFRVPREAGVGDALLRLRQALPNVRADANHRFQLMGDDPKTYGRRLIGWNGTAACGAGQRIGLVDTPVEIRHPALSGRWIRTRAFLPNGVAAASAEHGTATAALLVGKNIGLVPAAGVYAANVFRARDKEADTTAEWVVFALNWLAESRVSIINLSLGGPRNLIVEAATGRLLDRGIAIVAAAGNGGADAPPVFPAAQPGVLAVTAVDARFEPYKRANRGEYISFAAPGVDVWTALPGRDGAYVSGTSYSAPFLTATLAVARQRNSKSTWPAIVKQLRTRARDLGAPGKDPVFGWGLIQAAACRAPARRRRR
jgi:Subtilase family